MTVKKIILGAMAALTLSTAAMAGALPSAWDFKDEIRRNNTHSMTLYKAAKGELITMGGFVDLVANASAQQAFIHDSAMMGEHFLLTVLNRIKRDGVKGKVGIKTIIEQTQLLPYFGGKVRP